MSILGWLRRFKRLATLDPVHHCSVFKELGCAHVDGLLCDFPSCRMRQGYERSKRKPKFEVGMLVTFIDTKLQCTNIFHIHQVKFFDVDNDYRYAGFAYRCDDHGGLQYGTTVTGVPEAQIMHRRKDEEFGPCFQPWGK